MVSTALRWPTRHSCALHNAVLPRIFSFLPSTSLLSRAYFFSAKQHFFSAGHFPSPPNNYFFFPCIFLLYPLFFSAISSAPKRNGWQRRKKLLGGEEKCSAEKKTLLGREQICSTENQREKTLLVRAAMWISEEHCTCVVSLAWRAKCGE